MRRRIATTILFLLFGAILNIALAGACALYSGGLRYYQIGFDTLKPSRASTEDLNWVYAGPLRIRMAHVTVGEFSSLGLTRRGFWELPEWWDQGPPPNDQWRPGKQSQIWSRITNGDFLPFLPFAIRTSAGWPMRSLQAEQWLDHPRHDAFEHIYPLIDVYTYRGGRPLIMQHRPGNSLYRFPRVLPMRPIWIGMAVNTVTWACLAWMIATLPSFLRRTAMRTLFRRQARLRSGLCPACAYPMGASDTCTECGRKLPVGAARAEESGNAPK